MTDQLEVERELIELLAPHLGYKQREKEGRESRERGKGEGCSNVFVG